MLKFPFTRSEFRDQFFEREPLLIRDAFSAKGMSWEFLDEALRFVDPSVEYVKMLHHGRIDQAAFTEEYIDIGLRRRRVRKDALNALLGDGATLVVNRIDLFSAQAAEICLEIGRYVGAQASANAYASFGSDPATNVHWDTHDVFAVQLIGKKKWSLYEPTHILPMSSQTSDTKKNEVPTTPRYEIDLVAGDILYVPRGWWHRVVPLDHAETLHLAVGVHAPLVLDYLIWATANHLPNYLEFRKSMINGSRDQFLAEEASKIVQQVLSDPAILDQFEHRLRAKDRVPSPFDIGRAARRSTDSRGHLSPACRVRLNTRFSGNVVDQLFNGRRVEFLPDHIAILHAFEDEFEITLEQLEARTQGVCKDDLSARLTFLVNRDVVSILPE